MNSAHVAEQQERKQWTKRQQIIHSYGNQEEDLSAEREEIVDSDSAVYSHIGGVHSIQGDGEGILIVMGHTTEEARGQVSTAQPSRKRKERKPCKCGSRTHSRVSFHGCPLNKHIYFAICILHSCHNFCISSLAISLIYILTLTFHLKEWHVLVFQFEERTLSI